MMHGREKSDPAIVATKPTNKAGRPAAEPVERRAGAEGNAGQQSTRRAQDRASVSQALDRVRQAARQRKKETVHRAPPPCQRRPAPEGVLRAQAGRRPRRGRADVAGLRGRPRAQARGPARTGPSGSVPGAAVPATVHPEAGRSAAARWRSPPWRTRSSRRATVAVLNAIYEEDFLGFSYGFRPGRGQHDALDALVVGITSTKVNYILDADIRSFFDAVSQDWLIRFLEHRIGDPRIIRLIQKWLKAGVLEDGVVTVSETGTGQGSVISPLLANVYLHYVFDLWAERWRRREATGDMIIVRYADDIVVGFEHEADARRFWDAMRERLRGVRAVAASGQDPPDRVRPPCGGQARAARARQAGDLQLPGLHLHLRQVARGQVPAQAEDPARPHAGEARGDQGGAAAAHAPADPRAGDMAEAGRDRLLRLPRGADQQSRRCAAFRHHVADLWRRTLRRRSQKDRIDMGADDEAGRRLAPQAAHPSSLAAAALRRQTPKVGAVCGNRRTYGSVRGALSNERPYRDPAPNCFTWRSVLLTFNKKAKRLGTVYFLPLASARRKQAPFRGKKVNRPPVRTCADMPLHNHRNTLRFFSGQRCGVP